MVDNIPDEFVEEIKQTFDLFDKDNSESIDREELGEVFRSLGQHYTEQELEEMIKEIDADKNGSIDFNESIPLAYQCIN